MDATKQVVKQFVTGRRGERGIALALVLAVLVCLLAVAIPFSISMRHEQGGVAFRASDDEARRAALAVRDLTLAHLAETAPDRDTTPWADGAAETTPDLEGAAKSIGLDERQELGPRGRLISSVLEDQSGRIDLNRASLPVVARMLGLSSTLARKLKPDDKEIRLVDGAFLQDEGFLWIDGEITYYKRRDGSTVLDLMRPAIVPGVFEPAKLSPDAREFEAGEEVVDFRAWMVAAWLWKAPEAGGGREARFETLAHPMAISQFKRGALAPEQRARLERLATIWSADGGRDRFGLATRVQDELTAGETQSFRVEQGAFVARGSLCRLRTYGGRVDYGFVTRTQRRDDGFALLLEMPVSIGADAYQAVAEFLLPRPVNVNACSKELLEILLLGLRQWGQREVDERVAKLVAERIVAARPLAGMKTLVDLLETMVTKEKALEDAQRMAILLNAEHSGSFLLERASLPFCFASDGVFDVRAAASLNFALNGRERARAFLHEVVATSGSGVSQRLFTTQRDFEEPWRTTRLARGWTTLPENLQRWVGAATASNPPSRLPAMLPVTSRYPSEELNDSGARLAPGRMTIRLAQDDRTWHFDGGRGDLDGKSVDGWRFADGPITFEPVGGEQGVQLVRDTIAGQRPAPFGVSMWWNPGRNLGVEQTLFDWKANAQAFNPELQDRVRLRFANLKLELEVSDAFLRLSEQDLYTSKIVYDFTDGLPLEGDTWYHVTAFCRGNRAGQMTLWVDGKPRGKYSHYTRLPSSLTPTVSGAQVAVDVSRLADGLKSFPSKGVVRVGHDTLEYTDLAGGSLVCKQDAQDHHGGMRPAPITPVNGGTPIMQGGATHPSQSGVELYGYTARLASDALAGSGTLDAEGLGEFHVAKVARSSAKRSIDIQATGGGSSFPIGTGFEGDATELDVVQLDGGNLQSKDKVFSRNGGFALLVSYYLGRTFTVYDPVDKNTETASDSYKTTKGSWIQGVEAIGYGGFDGNKLTGLRRGKALAQELRGYDLDEFSNSPVGKLIPGTVFHFVEPHAFVILPDPLVWGNFKPKEVTVLVIPISVRATGANVQKTFRSPDKESNAFDRCELVQIDSDFAQSGQGATEWVRYDALVRDQSLNWTFLRGDPERIAATAWWIEGGDRLNGQSNQIAGDNVANRLNDIGLNPTEYAPGQSKYEDLIELINREDETNPDASNLAFRGVLGTDVGTHEAGAKLLPVFRTFMQVPYGARPGRYDEVTFVGVTNERPERHIVNHAWSFPISEDWNGHAHLALLVDELSASFAATPNLNVQPGTATGIIANVNYEGDSRNFARILKFPSGELPSLWDGSSGIVVADGGGDGAMVDEVRIFAPGDPQQVFELGQYLLRRDITTTQDDRFELEDEGLRFPGAAFGNIAGLEGLHQDASVWQFGDDFVVCGQRNAGDPIAQEIATDGRTRFQTDPGFHHAGETGMVLPFLCMTRLANNVSNTESLLPLVDASEFPRQGVVLIDQEAIAYTDLARTGGGGGLYVPTYMKPPTNLSSQSRGDAAFRGRYGTLRQGHSQDAIVFFWPWRYADGYAERCDIPELASLELPIPARRALFHSLLWKDEQSDPLAALVATVRVQGRGDFAAEPGVDPDFFLFDKPGTAEEPNLIDRQGDLLRIRFHVRYGDLALDPVDFTRNSWKRAPRLELVGVEYLADRVVELHEESR